MAWQDECAPIGPDEGLKSCSHLAAVEQAMRDAGIVLRHVPRGGSPRYLLCDCELDEARLFARFPLAACVRYEAYNEHFGDGLQSLTCTGCQSAISVFDPSRRAPRFP